MPRTLSSTINTVLAAQYGETHDLMEITIPDPPNPDIIIYASSSALLIGAQQYEPLLASISSIKFSRGKAADNADIQLRNEDSAYSGLLSEPDRNLSGSEVVIKRAFLVNESPRTFEMDIIFIGFVTDWRVDQDFIRISMVSDMSKRGSLMAARPITQRCIWIFKDPATCGYVNGQGGSTNIQVPGQPVGVLMFNFCDKVFDSAGGCLGHANQWRFGGVPPLTPNAQILNLNSGVSPFEGYDPPDGRFDPDWDRGRRPMMYIP